MKIERKDAGVVVVAVRIQDMIKSVFIYYFQLYTTTITILISEPRPFGFRNSGCGSRQVAGVVLINHSINQLFYYLINKLPLEGDDCATIVESTSCDPRFYIYI